MADTEIMATDIDLDMDEVCGSLMLNNDDEGEMQAFVQQHLLSLLQPVNASIQGIQDDVNKLRRDVLTRHVKIDESLDRVDRQEQWLQTLNTNLNSANQKVGKMYADFAQTLDLSMKAARERVEGTCHRMDAQLQEVAARTCALDAWKAKMEGQEGQEAENGDIPQLQSGLADVDSRMKQMETQMAECQQTSESLYHCNLGLSQRLEQAKAKLDNSSEDLMRVIGTTTHHIEESKLNMANNNKKLKYLEERVVVASFDIESHAKKHLSTEADLEKLLKEMGDVEHHLHDDEAQAEAEASKIREEMLQLQKLDTRSAIRELGRTVDLLTTRLAETQETQKNTVEGQLRKLNEAADSATKSIADNVADIRNLDAFSDRTQIRFQKVEGTQADHGREQQHLLERSHTSLNEIKELGSTVNETMLTYDRELEKVTSRVYWCEKGLENDGATLNSLFADLATTNDKASRTSNRLNLAQSYLTGMTKGISEAQKRAADGLDGMIAADRLRPHEICLPGLPGTLPRRPATALT